MPKDKFDRKIQDLYTQKIPNILALCQEWGKRANNSYYTTVCIKISLFLRMNDILLWLNNILLCTCNNIFIFLLMDIGLQL